jgi:hypothetical protein
MKKIILFAISIVLFTSLQAQNTNLDYKFAIKAYNLSTYYENTWSGPVYADSSMKNYTTTDLKILQPTLAFQWRNAKHNFHEIELTSFQVGKTTTQTELTGNSNQNYGVVSGSNIITTNITLRYEYIIKFNKKETTKLVSSLGLGISPYYRQTRYEPKVSTDIPMSQQNVGFGLNVTPRLSYYLSSRIFLDVNIPICITEFKFTTNKEDNPTLDPSERTNTVLNIDAFTKLYSGRIGVGLKL